jgi:soluble lytic murein transglycosylase-like protein
MLCPAHMLGVMRRLTYRSHPPQPMPPPADLIALACATADRYELDPALVCAVVEQESAWDAHAIRYEPGFRTRYVAPLGLPPTEEIARSISWGLMQVMGQVAREHGFSGRFLSALCDPAAGLDIGCAVLASKLSAADQNAARALELWNGGANADYAAQVLARMAAYK